MMIIEAVLKNEVNVRKDGDYYFKADAPLDIYKIHRYNGSCYSLNFHNVDPVDPPVLSLEVMKHVAYIKISHVLIHVNTPQGEHIRDDARGIVLRRSSRGMGMMEEGQVETMITIKALSMESAFKLHSEILGAKTPSFPYLRREA